MNTPLFQIYITLTKVFFAILISASVPIYAGNSVEGKVVQSDGSHLKVFETWGWLIAQEKGVAYIEINEEEIAALVAGFMANIGSQPAPSDFRKIFPDIERLAKERRRKFMQTIEQRNETQARIFFKKLEKESRTGELPGGVRYEIIAPGSGDVPKLEQTVNVHYTARLIDGTEFMQFGPTDLVLVENHPICRGWTDALQRLRKGGTMRLYVPPPLPETEASNWGIEPGSAIVLEIELLDIKDTSPDALASSFAPSPLDEPPPPSDFSILRIMESWGWSVAQQTRIADLALAEQERSMIAKGLVEGIKGQPAPTDLNETEPIVKKFINQLKEAARQLAQEKQRAEASAFFAKLKTSSNVAETPDGLYYEIIKLGEGVFPKSGQIVLVDYVGRLINGTVFDRTDNEPLNVEVGTVIRGWNEGIRKIKKGGRIKLYIPPELGYKEMAISGHIAPIPPGSTLIYDIELLDIKDTVPGPESEKK